MKIDAILYSGSRISNGFASEAGTDFKAFIPFQDKTILEHTIDALKASEYIDRIIIIGPDAVINSDAAAKADAVIQEGSTAPDSVIRGIGWLTANGDQPDRVLIMTADLPFLRPEMVSTFLESCPASADICVPVIRKEDFEGKFAGCCNKYLNLNDGKWTMGYSLLMNPQVVIANLNRISKVYEARDNQLQMAQMLGPMFVMQFMSGKVKLNHIVDRCKSLVGCTASAIQGCAPELAYNIDAPEEYRYAAEHFAER